MGMTKKEAQRAAERIFGPRSEAVRVSAHERENRFHIASSCLRVSSDVSGPGTGYIPIILGSGASWESAIDHARTTPNGQLAIKQAQDGQEFAKKAIQSKSELEFATLIEEQVVKEALEMGASDAAVAAIRHKFAMAKEKIHESGSSEVGRQGQDGSGDRDDHEGGRGADQ